jgi:pilus assembly protein Flp/PilA
LNEHRPAVENRRRDLKGGRDMGFLGFVREDEGQGLVEYALIIAVIAVAVIVAMLFLRDQLTNTFSLVGNNLT